MCSSTKWIIVNHAVLNNQILDKVLTVNFTLNNRSVEVTADPASRLTRVLREQLGLTGTKVGCDAGDCGACTVLLDDRAVCACMVPVGRLEGSVVTTVEGLSNNDDGDLNSLQQSFLHYGAAQCGICTPGMLISATALLKRNPQPNEQEIEDALGGVLCRCTGYRKIVKAVLQAHGFSASESVTERNKAVGASIWRLDGRAKVDGSDIFGEDEAPADALWVKVIRSPHHHGLFNLGNLDEFINTHPGIVRVIIAADIPGKNQFGVIPDCSDQPGICRAGDKIQGRSYRCCSRGRAGDLVFKYQ